MFNILLILFIAFSSNAFAQNVTRVTSASQHPYKHVPNDMNAIDSPADGEALTYDSATSRFEWNTAGGGGSGNVGIGTVNYFPVYVGVSTLGPSSMVHVSGNVGVGTHTPRALLHVGAGNDNPSGSDITGYFTNNGSSVLAIRDSTNNVEFNALVNSTGATLYNQGNEQILLGATAGQGMVIRSGGNVGINSATPGQKLDVQGTIRASSPIHTSDGTVSLPGYTFTSDVDSGIYSGGANDLRIGTGGVNVITIGSGQNVGIGTLTPKAKLAIVGNVGIGSTSTSAFVTNSPYSFQNQNSGMIVEGNVGIGTFAAQIDGNGSGLLHVYAKPGTPAPTIVASGHASDQNVEIWSDYRGSATNLTAVLGASQAGTVSGALRARGTTAGALASGPETGGQAALLFNGASLTSSYIYNGTADPMYFGTSNLIRQTILADGNIGIGTTIPGGGLTVMNGNMGIGTWKPAASLEVKGGNILGQNGGIINDRTIGLTIDGGGSAITTGHKGYVRVPYACVIQDWFLNADQSGSLGITVQKDSTYPPTTTICGTECPTISSNDDASDTSLSSWTTAVSANDYFGFNVGVGTTITRATLTIKCKQ